MKPRLLEEHPTHFLVHDGKAQFRVPKFGLSPEMHTKIRALSEGGEVKKEPLMVPPPEHRVRARELYAEPVEHEKPREPYVAPDPEFEVQRAHGGSIPGYSGGSYMPVGFLNQDAPADPDAETSVPFASPAAEQKYLRDKENRAKSQGVIDVAKEQGLEAAKMDLTDPQNYAIAQQAQADERAKLPSLTPRRELAPAPVEPAAPSKPKPLGPLVAQSPDQMDAETSAEKQALLAKGNAEASRGEAEARALADQRNRLESIDQERRDLETRGRTSASEMMGQYRQQLDEMKKIDTAVDPGRFWASRSTGQKVLGVIGLALGAVGAGKDGVNRAAGMLSQAIDRDIEAQKSETEARLKKGAAALEGSQQMYAMNRRLFQDDIAANSASKASALEMAQVQIQQIAATASSPIAKAQAAALAAQVGQAAAKFHAETQQRAAMLGLEREKVRLEEARVNKSGVGKNAELLKGAIEAVDDLERTAKANPASPELAQKRASVLLHMNKLQGGRFNEEINKMNQALVPGNEGWNTSLRLGETIAPGLMTNKFDTLRKHIAATGNAPPNPAYGD